MSINRTPFSESVFKPALCGMVDCPNIAEPWLGRCNQHNRQDLNAQKRLDAEFDANLKNTHINTPDDDYDNAVANEISWGNQ